MFKKILVPTDLTEKSEKAFEIAISLAKDYGATITLLHVIAEIENVDDEEFSDFYTKLRERAHKGIGALKDKFKTEDLTIKKEVVVGRRVPEIIRFANDNDVDLIILGSHKIEDISTGEGWATISYKVAILAPCPVMMVK